MLVKVQMENLDEEQKMLAELIGLEAFKSLVRAFNGTSIYIPKFGLTETWIRNIVLDKAKEIKARPIDGQMNLTDFLE